MFKQQKLVMTCDLWARAMPTSLRQGEPIILRQDLLDIIGPNKCWTTPLGLGLAQGQRKEMPVCFRFDTRFA